MSMRWFVAQLSFGDKDLFLELNRTLKYYSNYSIAAISDVYLHESDLIEAFEERCDQMNVEIDGVASCVRLLCTHVRPKTTTTIDSRHSSIGSQMSFKNSNYRYVNLKYIQLNVLNPELLPDPE
jgi:hypothetical protein